MHLLLVYIWGKNITFVECGEKKHGDEILQYLGVFKHTLMATKQLELLTID